MERMRSWPPSPDEFVELRRPRTRPYSLGDFGNKFGGHLTDGDHVLAPAMGPDTVARDSGIHSIELLVAHGEVGSQSGEHVDKPVAVVVRCCAGEGTGLAVET